MSKTTEIQIEKSRNLIEGLRRHVREMGERGVSNNEINEMEKTTDENFGGFGREITAWQFYMLLTNYKNNYIDVTLERSCMAYECAKGVASAINHDNDAWSWFIE